VNNPYIRSSLGQLQGGIVCCHARTNNSGHLSCRINEFRRRLPNLAVFIRQLDAVHAYAVEPLKISEGQINHWKLRVSFCKVFQNLGSVEVQLGAVRAQPT
jgi:hypothetical protein